MAKGTFMENIFLIVLNYACGLGDCLYRKENIFSCSSKEEGKEFVRKVEFIKKHYVSVYCDEMDPYPSFESYRNFALEEIQKTVEEIRNKFQKNTPYRRVKIQEAIDEYEKTEDYIAKKKDSDDLIELQNRKYKENIANFNEMLKNETKKSLLQTDFNMEDFEKYFEIFLKIFDNRICSRWYDTMYLACNPLVIPPLFH